MRAAVSFFPHYDPEEKVVGKRGKERPVGSPERPVEEKDVCDTEAGMEVDAEDEDVDVVGGVADV